MTIAHASAPEVDEIAPTLKACDYKEPLGVIYEDTV